MLTVCSNYVGRSINQGRPSQMGRIYCTGTKYLANAPWLDGRQSSLGRYHSTERNRGARRRGRDGHGGYSRCCHGGRCLGYSMGVMSQPYEGGEFQGREHDDSVWLESLGDFAENGLIR